MKAFVEYCEGHWQKANQDDAVWQRMRVLLSSAMTAAGENNIYRERIDMIDQFMQARLKVKQSVFFKHMFSQDLKHQSIYFSFYSMLLYLLVVLIH